MIRLRRMLERGRTHPVLGPIVLVLLVLVLAMMCLHAAYEGWDAAAELGAVCVVLTTILGGLVLGRPARSAPEPDAGTHRERGPPNRVHPGLAGWPRPARLEVVLPLRR